MRFEMTMVALFRLKGYLLYLYEVILLYLDGGLKAAIHKRAGCYRVICIRVKTLLHSQIQATEQLLYITCHQGVLLGNPLCQPQRWPYTHSA